MMKHGNERKKTHREILVPLTRESVARQYESAFRGEAFELVTYAEEARS